MGYGRFLVVHQISPPMAEPSDLARGAGSSCLPRVELESPVRAQAERLRERRASGEPQHLRSLGSELPIGISGQMQPAGNTPTWELVIPGGRELAGTRLDPLVVPHPRER